MSGVKKDSLFDTVNYRVVIGTFPSGEYEGQSCYIVENKLTGVGELFVNLLPKAIYLAIEAEDFLKEVRESENPVPNDKLLIN